MSFPIKHTNNFIWEGPQFGRHSLTRFNKELLALIIISAIYHEDTFAFTRFYL